MPVGAPSLPPRVALYWSIALVNVAVRSRSCAGMVNEWVRAPPSDQPVKVRSSTVAGTETELFDPTATLRLLVGYPSIVTGAGDVTVTVRRSGLAWYVQTVCTPRVSCVVNDSTCVVFCAWSANDVVYVMLTLAAGVSVTESSKWVWQSVSL